MSYQTYRLNWRGIEIEARYAPSWSTGSIAHLEIESMHPPRVKLPMTETGYKSYFHAMGTIETEFAGDVIAYVEYWLNEAAENRKWKRYEAASQQLELF